MIPYFPDDDDLSKIPRDKASFLRDQIAGSNLYLPNFTDS